MVHQQFFREVPQEKKHFSPDAASWLGLERIFFFIPFEMEFHYVIKLSSDSLGSLGCPLPPTLMAVHHPSLASQVLGLQMNVAYLCSLWSTIRQLWQVRTSQVSQNSLSTSCVCRGQYRAKSPEPPPFTPIREESRCGLLFT